MPANSNGIEAVVGVGPVGDPELGSTEVLGRLNLWLPQVEGAFSSIVAIISPRICYGILLIGKDNKAKVSVGDTTFGLVANLSG